MDETPGPGDGALTLLKWLVIALTATMVIGMATLVVLFVTRFPAPAPRVEWPAEIDLPDGLRASAVTRGDDWIAVVTATQEILVYDARTGALRQRIDLE